MKKVVFALALTLTVGNAFAQDEAAKEEVKDGWKKGGNVALTFNQSAFNNEWTGGGIGNTAANILVNYDANMVKGDMIWDNKLILDYGVNKNDGQDAYTKSNDRIEFNSLAGKKMKGFWYYTVYLNAKTQMDRAADGGTHFFSPAYFQAGPGILWKKSDNLNVNISPLAAKYIIVHSEYTEVPAASASLFPGYFGVDANKTSRLELGAAIRGYYKTDLMKNISVENILALYTNYLEDPQNVDVDYTMNLVMKVNKYISTNLVFQAIYDDNAQRNGFQIREAFGIGVNATF